MVRFDDIDVSLNETLRVARVLEIQKAGKILLSMPFTGLRKGEMVGRFIEGFHSRFATRDEQNDALYRFQHECLDNHTALSRLSEKYRAKPPRNASTRGDYGGRSSSNGTAAPISSGGQPLSSGRRGNPNLIPITSAAATYYPPNSTNDGPHRGVQTTSAYVPHDLFSSNLPPRLPAPLASTSGSTNGNSNYMQNGTTGHTHYPAVNLVPPPSPYHRPPLPYRPPRHAHLMSVRMPPGGGGPSPNTSANNPPPPFRAHPPDAAISQWRPIYPGTGNNSHGPPNAASVYSPQYPPHLSSSFVAARDDYGSGGSSSYAAPPSAMQQPSPASYASLSSAVQKQVYSSYIDAELALRQYKFRMDSVCFPQTMAMSPPPNFIVMNKDLPRIWYARVRHHLRMPFYRNLEMLVPPVRLLNIMSVKSAAYLMGTLRFNHSPDRLTANHASSSSKTDLMIRFFKIDENEPQLDTLPPNVTVEIRSASSYTSGPPLSLYRTTLVRFKKAKPKHEKPIVIPYDFAVHERSIDVIITYTPSESDYEFAVGIFRAQTVSIEEEVASIRHQPLDAFSSKQSILRELKPDAGGDDDISAAEVSSLPLKCPISKSRIKVPCRSMQCTVHHTCDAYSFVEMNFERPTWRCFLCNKDVYLQDVRFETFIDSLLRKFDGEAAGKSDVVNFVLNEKGDDLMIKQDLSSDAAGTAAPLAGGKKPQVAAGSTNADAAGATDSGSNAATSKKAATSNDVICLSSDDEDKMKNEDMDISPPPPKNKNKTDETNSGTSRFDNDDHGDTDSSDENDDDDNGTASDSSSDVDVGVNAASNHGRGTTPSSSTAALSGHRRSGRVSNNSNRTAGKRRHEHDAIRRRLKEIRRRKRASQSDRTAAEKAFFKKTAAAAASKKAPNSTVGPNGVEVIDLTLSSDEEGDARPSATVSCIQLCFFLQFWSKRWKDVIVEFVPPVRKQGSTSAAPARSSSSSVTAPYTTAGTSSSAQHNRPSNNTSAPTSHSTLPPSTPTTPGTASILSANVLVADAVVDGLLAVMNRGMADRMPQRPPPPPPVSVESVAASSSAYQQYVTARNAATNMPHSYPADGGINYSNNSSPYNAFMSPYAPLVASPAPPPSVSPSSSSSQGRVLHTTMPTAMPNSGNSPPQIPPLLPPPPPPPIHLMSYSPSLSTREWRQPPVTTGVQPSYGPPRIVRQQSSSSASTTMQSTSSNVHAASLSSSLMLPLGTSTTTASGVVNISLPSYNGTPMSTPAHSHQNSPKFNQQQQHAPSYSLQSVNFNDGHVPTFLNYLDATAAAASSLTPTPNDAPAATTVQQQDISPPSAESNSFASSDRTPKASVVSDKHGAASPADDFDDLMNGVGDVDDSVYTAMFGEAFANGGGKVSSSSKPSNGFPGDSSRSASNSASNISSSTSSAAVQANTPSTNSSTQQQKTAPTATSSAADATAKPTDVRLKMKMTFVNSKPSAVDGSLSATAGNSITVPKDSTSASSDALTKQPTQPAANQPSSQERPVNKLTFRIVSSAASAADAAAADKLPSAIEVRRPPSFTNVLSSSSPIGSRASASSPGGSRTSSSSAASSSDGLSSRASSAATTKPAAGQESTAKTTTPHVPPLTIRLSSSAARKPPTVAVSSRIPWADDDNASDGEKRDSDDSDDNDVGGRRRDRRRVPPLALHLRNAPLQNRITTNASKSAASSSTNLIRNIGGSRNQADGDKSDNRKPANSLTLSRPGSSRQQPQKKTILNMRRIADDGGRSDDDQFENLNEMLEDFGNEPDNILQPAFPRTKVKPVPRNEENAASNTDDEANDADAAANSPESRVVSRASNKRHRKKSSSDESDHEEDEVPGAPRRSGWGSRSANAADQRRRSLSETGDDDEPSTLQRVSYSANRGDFDADLIAPSSDEEQERTTGTSSSSSFDSDIAPKPAAKNGGKTKARKPAVKIPSVVTNKSTKNSRNNDADGDDSDPDFDPARSQTDEQDSIWLPKRKPAGSIRRRRVRIAEDDDSDEDEDEEASPKPVRRKPNANYGASSDEGDDIEISRRKPTTNRKKPSTSHAAAASTSNHRASPPPPPSKSKPKKRTSDDEFQLDSDDAEFDRAASVGKRYRDDTDESNASGASSNPNNKRARSRIAASDSEDLEDHIGDETD